MSERVPPRRLRIPLHYGESAALQSMSTIAAPLLAAGALALFGVVVQAPDQLRSPGATLLALSLAVALFVLCVQAGLWARHYFAMPSEIKDWHYSKEEDEQKEFVLDLVDDQPTYFAWSRVAWWSFGTGIVALWLALATAALPKPDATDVAARYCAATLFALLAAGEVLWLVGSVAARRRDHAPPGLGPATE